MAKLCGVFKENLTGCKYGDVFATFWGKTLLEIVCRNHVLVCGTNELVIDSLSRPVQQRYFGENVIFYRPDLF